MPVDPLLALLVGAFGASLVGLLGAWIQSGREHRRWLRERRYEAYRAFMIDMDAFHDLIKADITMLTVVPLGKRAKVLAERFSASFEAVSLLGPKKVNAAGTRWIWAATDLKNGGTPSAYNEARWKFLIAAGDVLKSANVTTVPMTRDGKKAPGE